MTIAKIHGSEHPIRKIFSNDFNFKVPLYQRPYSWTTEQAGELLDDLISFIGPDTGVSIDELSPYFLGSIVLIKEESQPEAEVVDGQQRLTTLTILLSALRHTITTPAYSGGMTDYLYQEGKPLEGTANRYRLRLRERDADFFRTHVQDAGQIAALKKLNAGQLSDSQQNIRANAMLYLEALGKLSEDQRVRLAQFVVKNCLLVVVSTPDLDSAYRIFSILNDRGLDLSHSDILKSEVIGAIPPKEQAAFNDKWEDAEEELGRDAFSDLFAHTRMIFRRAKAKETILKEFREFVIKKMTDSKLLINEVLIPFADAFATIQTASYESTAGADQVNQMLAWLGRIDNTDWIPPAIFYLARNKSDAKSLYRFFTDLERLAAFLMICRYGINERIERYGKLLEAIDTKTDLYTANSPLQLSDTEYLLFLQELNGEVYRQVPQRRLYILLRLDSALSDGSATYDHSVISIEHVLPQNPPPGSKWCEWFPTPDLRDHWLHRLGNLLLLNHKKNSSASNYEFDKKKAAYFTKGGVSPFPLTTQAVGEKEWTAAVVEARQKALLEVLKKAWRVRADIPTDEPPVTKTPPPEEEDGDEGEVITAGDGGSGKKGPETTAYDEKTSQLKKEAMSKRSPIEAMQLYLNAPANKGGKTPAQMDENLDKDRATLIDTRLKPLVADYLSGKSPLETFKSKTDGTNKEHRLWGFQGIKGQMFFNMVVKVAGNAAECDKEIKAAIAVPPSEDVARTRITAFAGYVRGIGDAHVKAGGGKQGRPKLSSVPFFLSYFWQVQDRQTWPIYYTNAVNTLGALGLWQPDDDLAESYIGFKHLYEELAQKFSQASGKQFDLYGVEHVFWFLGDHPLKS
jgi:uncharacterized protein with ParB-like and HNH nuclease domain